MVAAEALPRARCFVEDEQKTFAPYDFACRLYADASEAERPRRAPPPGGRHAPDQVLLHVYELVAFGHMNRFTAPECCPLGGALHVGVEVFGREWSYGGGHGPGSGVICEVPRTNTQHRFRETLLLGRTALSDGEVALIMGDLVEKWQSKDYHWLHMNCLAFANELCERLGVGRIPAWIDRFARGAGVVDSGVRGLAGGLAERVHGVAVGARDVVRAIVQGPRSCTSCATAALQRKELQAPASGCQELCLVQACGVQEGPPRREDSAACLRPSRSLFEVVNDPEERTAYSPGAGEEKAGRLERWFRLEEGSRAGEADPSEGAGLHTGRLERWLRLDEVQHDGDPSPTAAAAPREGALSLEGPGRAPQSGLLVVC